MKKAGIKHKSKKIFLAVDKIEDDSTPPSK